MPKAIWTPTLPPYRTYKAEVYRNHALTSQFIYQLGEGDTIRSTSKKVKQEEITGKAFQKKIQYVKECFLRYREITGVGRGLAAIQVGISERFAIIYLPDRKEKLVTIINPNITKKAKKLLQFTEGCMSEGPIFAPVIRPSWIEFTYFDEKGKERIWKEKDEDASGRIANRVFQHEIDHMDGIIFLDRAILSELTLESDPRFYETASFEEVF